MTRRPAQPESTWDRVKTGVRFGGAVSLFLVPMLLIVPFTGFDFLVVSTNYNYHLHLGVLFVAYPVGATLTGILFSIGRPYVRSRPVAVSWGALSISPWVVAFALARS